MLPVSSTTNTIVGDPEFVKKLEEKLKKCKKSPENLSSSDILSEIKTHKTDRLDRLVNSSSSFFDEEHIGQPLQYNLVQKKINPEKIALNREELEKLVEKDFLNLNAVAGSSEVVELSKDERKS